MRNTRGRLPLVVSPQFEDVYRQHIHFVWRCLRRFGVSDADAMDAAQEVFLVVLRRLPEFEGRSQVTSWLFAICYRVAGTRARSARVRAKTVVCVPEPDAVDERTDVLAAVERREARALVEAILDELPLEQRAVFALFELEGLETESIAEGLGIPVGTVYSRLHAARKAFRAALDRRRARDRNGLARAAGLERVR